METNEKYDYKKIVEEFERWLSYDFCSIKVRGRVHRSERLEASVKFLEIKSKNCCE